MDGINLDGTIGDLLRGNPGLSRVFETFGIDYCCGGGVSLAEACRARGLDVAAVAAALQHAQGPDAAEDPASLPLWELPDLIEKTHHAYLREELPRLEALTRKVAKVHGPSDPRLADVRDVFAAFSADMQAHMQKEEGILFPMIRQLESEDDLPVFHCGSLANPIRRMLAEHEEAAGAFGNLRLLTDGYAAPEWACNSYRAMLEGLRRLEADTRAHVEKENGILFPRALELESAKRESGGSQVPFTRK